MPRAPTAPTRVALACACTVVVAASAFFASLAPSSCKSYDTLIGDAFPPDAEDEPDGDGSFVPPIEGGPPPCDASATPDACGSPEPADAGGGDANTVEASATDADAAG